MFFGFKKRLWVSYIVGKQIVSSKSFQRGLTNDWDGFEESAKENRGVLGWSYQEALTTPRPGE